MKVRAGLFAIGILVGCAATTGAATDAANPAANRLRAFDGCPSFVSYVRQHALPLVGPSGLDGIVGGFPVGALPPRAARGAVEREGAEDAFSRTNVQEDGVDEPDLAKTNGKHLFVALDGRINAVDVRAPRPRLVGTLRLPLGGADELLLHGTRLLVLSRVPGKPVGSDGPVGIREPGPLPTRSVVTEVDVRDPARLRVVRTMELGGTQIAARLVGRTARIVVASPMGVDLRFVQPTTPGAEGAARAAARNAEIVRATDARSWLPSYTVRGARGRVTARGRLVQCRNVRRPPSFSGLGLVTVLTLDVERGLEPIDSDAVVSDGRVVYASRTRLYVAAERWDRRLLGGQPLPGRTATTIHAFDIASPSQTHYRASGSVPGVLLNQWSLSERQGILRVASTDRPLWWGGPEVESESMVTTLEERASALVQLGRVGGLGRGERVYAVRFAGDVGYVVTFRQVDPLYTLDLSVPGRPAVRGELKIRGFSSYLHPVGPHLLLGIGQDATDEGRVVGGQASLFDVSDLRRPRRLDAVSLGRSWSAVEQDHHAFLWWPRTRLAVLPVTTVGDLPFAGALGLRVGGTSLSLAGRLSHPASAGSQATAESGAPILRSLVVGDTLYTVSSLGVKASSLATLADVGFARFGD